MNRVNSCSGSALLVWQHHWHCCGYYYYYYYSPWLSITTQPKSWYSFHRPAEGRRLSWLGGWLHVIRQSPVHALSRPGVRQLRWLLIKRHDVLTTRPHHLQISVICTRAADFWICCETLRFLPISFSFGLLLSDLLRDDRCSVTRENSALSMLYHNSINCKWFDVYRVTTCLENLEMSGNLKHVREMSGIMLTVGEMSGKKFCQGKVSQNCSSVDEYLRSYGYLSCYLNISISFKNSAYSYIYT